MCCIFDLRPRLTLHVVLRWRRTAPRSKDRFGCQSFEARAKALAPQDDGVVFLGLARAGFVAPGGTDMGGVTPIDT